MSSLVLQQFERGPVNWVKIECNQLTETVQCAQDKLLGGKEEGGGGRGGEEEEERWREERWRRRREERWREERWREKEGREEMKPAMCICYVRLESHMSEYRAGECVSVYFFSPPRGLQPS